jgi:hypothetical protein
VSTQKEVEFFSRCWDHGVDWYRTHFARAGSATAVGEFSVSYLTHPAAARRIFDVLGPVRIIVSLRDPAARFISHYKHYIRNGKLPLAEYARLDVATLHKAIDFQPELFDNGRYAAGLARYVKLFGRNAVHVVEKEAIDRSPSLALRELFQFLDIDATFRPKLEAARVGSGIVPRSAALERLRIATYRFAERRFPRLIVMSRQLGAGEVYRRFNNRRELPGVTAEAEHELGRLYRDEIAAVEDLLEQRFDWAAAR